VPGQLADVAVMSRDLFEIPHDDVLTTECLMTLVGGKVAFTRAALELEPA